MENIKTYYDIYCRTCINSENNPGKWYIHVESENLPTTCPTDTTHTNIDVNFNEIVPVSLNTYDFKGRLRTVNTSRSDPYTWSYFTSAGDHPTLGIGEGASLHCDLTTQTTSGVISVDFIEDVEMHYGMTSYQNMTVNDRVSVWSHAPATITKAWDNVSPIRLVKYEIIAGSGLHLLIPHPEGAFMFDESDGKFPIPVEAYDASWNPTGHWDRDLNPASYASSQYTVNTQNQGQFDFFDFPIDLGWFVNNCKMISKNSSSMIFGNEDAFRCYRGWQMRLEVENGNTNRTSDNSLSLAVILKLNRKTIR